MVADFSKRLPILSEFVIVQKRILVDHTATYDDTVTVC